MCLRGFLPERGGSADGTAMRQVTIADLGQVRLAEAVKNQQICKMKVINSKMPDSQSLRKVKHFRKSNKKKSVLSKIKVKHYLMLRRKQLRRFSFDNVDY